MLCFGIKTFKIPVKPIILCVCVWGGGGGWHCRIYVSIYTSGKNCNANMVLKVHIFSQRHQHGGYNNGSPALKCKRTLSVYVEFSYRKHNSWIHYYQIVFLNENMLLEQMCPFISLDWIETALHDSVFKLCIFAHPSHTCMNMSPQFPSFSKAIRLQSAHGLKARLISPHW